MSIDGVLVDTRAHQIAAWQQLTEDIGFEYVPAVGATLPLLPPMEALDRLLGVASRDIDVVEKRVFLDRWHQHYRVLLATLTARDVITGARGVIIQIRHAGVPLGGLIASAGERALLECLGVAEWFDALYDVDGTDARGIAMAVSAIGARADRAAVVSACEQVLLTAREAGVRTVRVGYRAAPACVADVTVPSISAVTAEGIARPGTSGTLAEEAAIPAA